MTSWLHVRGQPQKLCFQVCFQRLDFSLNAWSHITQELVMSRVQNSLQRGNLNLPIIQLRFHSVCKWYPATILHVTANFLLKNQKSHGVSSYFGSNVVKLCETALTGRTSSSRGLGRILWNLGLFCSPDMFTWDYRNKNCPIKYRYTFRLRVMIFPF